MNKSELYNALTRFGDSYQLNISGDTGRLMEDLQQFDKDWKPYNPRKAVNREGLSITSLDGGLSGIPDLDSVYEYNKKHNVLLTEHSFKTKTPVYQYCSQWLDFLGDHMSRTHLIRLYPGGYFPIHRDNKTIDIDNFRLFIPIKNCNYPDLAFVLNRQTLAFNEGAVYFLDTCKEHYLFNFSIGTVSTFIVVNVDLTESAVKTILKHLRAG
jgi:hypothetical protein